MGHVDELNVQAIACSQQVEEHGSVDVVQGQRLALQILSFGQAELVGNRATEANFWAVVCATEAAFPLLLGASLDQARQTAASVGAGGNANLVRDLWILQGVSDGTLSVLVEKVRSQPQILGAYKRTAPMRSRESVMEFCAALACLKGARFDALEMEPLDTRQHASNGDALVSVPEIPSGTPTATPTPSAEAGQPLADAPASAQGRADESGPARSPGHRHAEELQDGRQIERADKSTAQPAGDAAAQHSYVQDLSSKAFETVNYLKNQIVHSGHGVHVAGEGPGASDAPMVAVHLDPVEGGDRGVVMRLEVAADTLAATSPGYTTRGLGLVSGAASLVAAPTASSLAWLRARAGDMPGLPFSRHSATPGQPAPLPESPSSPRPPTSAGAVAQSAHAEPGGAPGGGSSSAVGDGAGSDVSGPSGDIRNAPAGGGEAGGNEQSMTEIEETDAEKAAGRQPDGGLQAQQNVEHESKDRAGSQAHSRSSSQQSTPSLFGWRAPGFGYWRQQDQGSRPDTPERGRREDAAADSSAAVDSRAQEEGTSGSGLAKVSQKAAFAGGDGSPAAAPLSPAEHQILQEGQEVGDRLQGEAQALLECALAAPATLALDGMRVDRLCSLVAQLLGHGLTGRAAPPPTWLPSWQASKPSVLEMLQEAGFEVVQPGKAAADGDGVCSWVRDSLAQHCLGSRLLDIFRNHALLEAWYSRAALVRQETSGRALGLLVSLDGITFAAPAPAEGGDSAAGESKEEEEDATTEQRRGFLSSVAGMLRRAEASGTAHSLNIAESIAAAARGPKRKPSTRSVKIERSTDDQVWGEPQQSPRDFLTPSASLGILSPLSSMELSAEPLSPSTLAFFKAARAQALGARQEAGNSQEPEASPAGPSPFSADFIASVLAKLPEEEGEAAVPSSQPLQQGHSQFLDSLLGHPTSSEPAILPAPGQFSLVGRIAQPAAAADGVSDAGDIAAAAPDEGSKGGKSAELWAAPDGDGDAERRDQMQTEVKAQTGGSPPSQSHEDPPAEASSAPAASGDGESSASAGPPQQFDPPDDTGADSRSAGGKELQGEDLQKSLKAREGSPPDSAAGEPALAIQHVCIRSAATMSEGPGKEFTAFTISAGTGGDLPSWQVKRRFRDFSLLESRLRARHGDRLPQIWADIRKARSLTGAARLAPEVVEARRHLCEKCLKEAIAAGPPLATSPPLLAFLDVPAEIKTRLQGPTLPSAQLGSSTMRFLVDLPAEQSLEELAEAQHGSCAGCRQELAAAPKNKAASRCHYSGLAYCWECMGRNQAVLPALVVHSWDFSKKPVCNMAADFLIATHQQPLVSVNNLKSGLLEEVPTLGKAVQLRNTACKALQAASASSPQSAAQVESFLDAAGSRRALLVGPDNWSMEDLIDISKASSSEVAKWLDLTCPKATSLATAALLAPK